MNAPALATTWGYTSLKRISFLIPALVLSFGFLTGCVTPSYVDKGDNAKKADKNLPVEPVQFKVHQAFQDTPPECVAVLPFEAKSTGKAASEKFGAEEAEVVRRAFYAHLSPMRKRDIDLDRVDFDLGLMPEEDRDNHTAIGKKLDCDSLMMGEVTKYGEGFFGIYSNVSVGAKVRIIRARDGIILWEGEHVAESHGGSVPLSPFGLVSGMVSAAINLEKEQKHRVTDDLARRLVSTIPDDNQFAYVMATVLNLRTGPGTDYPVQDRLRKSDKIEVVGRSADGQWMSIKSTDGKQGYVASSHVSVSPDVTPAPREGNRPSSR